MTANQSATARGRSFIRILGWVAAPIGVVVLVTGIVESAAGSGVGWPFIVLGVVLLGVGVLCIRVSTVRPDTPTRS